MSCSPSSPTPPSAGLFISDHKSFPHTVQFYLDEAFLLRMISQLVLNTFKAGDRALIIATAAHHKGLIQTFEKYDVDIRVQQNNGNYIAVNADDVLTQCTASGELDLEHLRELLEKTLRNAANVAGKQQAHLFIFGELVALLAAQQKFEAVLAVENVWQQLSHKFSFSLLCGYPIQQFECAGQENFFLRICENHSTVVPPDAYSSSASEKKLLQALAADV